MYLRLSYFCVTAKRKLGISNDENITIYTEADGTEIDEDSFPELEAGCILVCAEKNEVWLPPEIPATVTAAASMSTTASMSLTVDSNAASSSVSTQLSGTHKPGNVHNLLFIS